MSFLSNIGSSSNTATFFELAMVDQGGLSLWPAFQHVLTTLTTQSPISRSMNFISYFGREIFTLLRAIVEGYLLQKYNSTAFELLYGLRRACVISSEIDSDDSNKQYTPNNPFQQNNDPPPSLPRKEVLLSVFEIVLLPYFAAKMDNMHARAVKVIEKNEKRKTKASMQLSKRSKRKRIVDFLRTCFVLLYPYTRKGIGIVLATYQLIFALGRTQYFSPMQHFWKYNVIRDIPSPNQDGIDFASEMLSIPTSFKEKVAAWAVTSIQYGVVAGVLVFKFAEWWYTPEVQELAQSSSSGNEEILPPPPIDLIHNTSTNNNDIIPYDSNSIKCPLCKEQCTNMAASPSGFIYCYPCLYKFVKTNNKAPRSEIFCNTENLRNVYF